MYTKGCPYLIIIILLMRRKKNNRIPAIDYLSLTPLSVSILLYEPHWQTHHPSKLFRVRLGCCLFFSYSLSSLASRCGEASDYARIAFLVNSLLCPGSTTECERFQLLPVQTTGPYTSIFKYIVPQNCEEEKEKNVTEGRARDTCSPHALSRHRRFDRNTSGSQSPTLHS